MTVQAVFQSDVSDAAFRCFYALQDGDGDYSGGVKGLAGILGWSESKTGRVLRELQSAGIVRVVYGVRQTARVFISDGSAEDLEDIEQRSVDSDGSQEAPEAVVDNRSVKNDGSAEDLEDIEQRSVDSDGSQEASEAVVDNRSVKNDGSCTDTDCISTVPEQTESEALDRADMQDLRARLEALAFRGIEWALRTFDPDVLDKTVETVEDLAREGIAYNPGGLLNSALRGKVLLFRPEKGSESDGDGRSPEAVSSDQGGHVDPEHQAKAEEQREFYATYWEEFKGRRERYPADCNNGPIVPDTYTRHQDEVPEKILDPSIGIGKLREGLARARAVA